MQDRVERLSALLKQKNMMLASAESCTGGLFSAVMTGNAGASTVFERGFITYSNEAKKEMLGVSEETLQTYGAVSGETAEAMARGVIERSHAGLAISITGIAGPDGGSAEKPVGLVYFGFALKGGSSGSIEGRFTGGREQIRIAAASAALIHLINVLEPDL
ncbi:MAG: CinA family protein [Alphaproteobacteria bacterium]|nr:CinA family protein [Alphaproteobacteria bacterium]